MKLLLHVCCAPCAIYPIKAAGADGFDDIKLFFYNPNIQPAAEHKRRLSEANKILTVVGADNYSPLHYTEYDPGDYFCTIKNFGDPKKRCSECWGLRLSGSAQFAKENGFDAFTSTLLASPYQDHETLKHICEKLASETGVRFYYKDFREGFRKAHDEAKAKGIYCQNYCGCIFSMVERLSHRA